jgi:mannose-1-phosphate guanylyltransferase
MKAMILAAGLGTRLRPLTLVRPKPLIPVVDRPLIRHLAERLTKAGVTELVVNTHHLADQVRIEVMAMDFPLPATVSHEPAILGTGGALRHARELLGEEPFLVVNCDIYTEMDLAAVYEAHMQGRPLATMVLRDEAEFNSVVLADDRILTFSAEQAGGPGSDQQETWAYTGVQVVEPAVFDQLPEGFSHIIDVYEAAMAAGETVAGYIDQASFWDEAGDLGRYLNLHQRLMARRDEKFWVHPRARVDEGIEVRGFACVGAGAVVEAGACLENAVIWPGTIVKENARVIRSVVATGVLGRTAEDEAVVA